MYLLITHEDPLHHFPTVAPMSPPQHPHTSPLYNTPTPTHNTPSQHTHTPLTTPPHHPPHPLVSGPGAQIGGMCACRCSGSTAVKYGSMRENVLNLTAVLSDGTIIKTGSRARKSSAGRGFQHTLPCRHTCQLHSVNKHSK